MKLISPEVNGIKYIIHNKNDHIQNILYNGNHWDVDIINIIKTYIIKYNLKHFLNVGSHIGSVCLPISLHINNVTAIEAYPETYNHLCENIQLNNISNINTINIAVGNSEEDVYFMSCDKICPIENTNRIINNSGGMHVFTENDIQNNIRSGNLSDKKIQNKMNKLDNLGIDNFDIMLVDIEGYEYDFLLGAKGKLIKYKPIIIIEIWNDNKREKENMNTTQYEIIKYIEFLDYTLINQIGDDFIFIPNKLLDKPIV
jgi:FkbM family methyltransferase